MEADAADGPQVPANPPGAAVRLPISARADLVVGVPPDRIEDPRVIADEDTPETAQSEHRDTREPFGTRTVGQDLHSVPGAGFLVPHPRGPDPAPRDSSRWLVAMITPIRHGVLEARSLDQGVLTGRSVTGSVGQCGSRCMRCCLGWRTCVTGTRLRVARGACLGWRRFVGADEPQTVCCGIPAVGERRGASGGTTVATPRMVYLTGFAVFRGISCTI